MKLKLEIKPQHRRDNSGPLNYIIKYNFINVLIKVEINHFNEI